LLLPCHVRNLAGVPVTDVLVEDARAREHATQGVAAHTLRLNAAFESGNIITRQGQALNDPTNLALAPRVSVISNLQHLAKVVTLPVIHRPISWSKAIASSKTLSGE